MRVIVFLITLLISQLGYSQGDQSGIHRFYLEYAIVMHSLKNDQGAFDDLMSLQRLDSKAAEFLADFWFSKARRDCQAASQEIAKNYARRGTAGMSQTEKDRLVKAARDEIDQCRYGVYYNNWDEINRMIKQRYATVLQQQK